MRFPRSTGSGLVAAVLALAALTEPGSVHATPANKSALEKHLGPLLADTMQNCAICHIQDHGTGLESLEEFPHNPFGDRIRIARTELRQAGKRTRISDRLAHIAEEDSDGDGVTNLEELLLGHFPGNKADTPSTEELNGIEQTAQPLRRLPEALSLGAVSAGGTAHTSVRQFRFMGEKSDRCLHRISASASRAHPPSGSRSCHVAAQSHHRSHRSDTNRR